MNPYLIIGALIVWGVTFVGGYGYGHRAGVDRTISSQTSADQVRRETIEAAQQGAATAIAALKPLNTTIVQKVQRELQTNTVYRDCKLPPAGLQLANEAITGRPAEPAGGGVVPGANPAPR